MSFMSLKYFLIVSLTFKLILAANIERAVKAELKPLEPSETYPHDAAIDEDDPGLIRLFWKTINNEEIQFELHCRTTGWCGFGLSPNGDMLGDIAIGWVDSTGKGHLKDTHVDTSKTRPISDKQQDLTLIDSKELNGYTILKFKRKLNTCDKDDIEIKIETNYMIFAWHDEDPLTGNDDWKKHVGNNKRSKVDYLLSFKEAPSPQQQIDEEGAYKFEMKLNNHPVKKQDTYYYCQLYDLPQYAENVQMIRYDVLIPKENKDMVHHIVVHMCERSFLQTPDNFYGHECGAIAPPQDIGACLGSSVVIAWAIGGSKNTSFPANTGLPLYKTESRKMILIEYHYDNPRLQDGRTDSSGIRLYFTKDLRQHELGVLTLNSFQSSLSSVIPPESENQKLTSICYPECTNNFFPKDGINVIAGYLHTHLAGRAIRTLLIRDGKTSRLFDNPNYNSNYQNVLEIEPFKLHKNDTLVLQCFYDTKDRKRPTYWGFSTNDEMCMNFMLYYPRIKSFDMCTSDNQWQVYANFYRQLIEDKLINVDYTITSVTEFWSHYYELAVLLQTIDVTGELKQRLTHLLNNPGIQTGSCGSYAAGNVYEYPKEFLKLNEPPEEVDKCKASETTTTTTTPMTPTKSSSSRITSQLGMLLLSLILITFF